MTFTFLLTASPAASLKLLGQFQPKDGGAEIVSFTPDGHRLATMFSGGKDGNGVQILKLDSNGVLAEEHVFDLGKLFDGKILTLSSVALDPLGRGLGAVVAVPTENSKVQGKLVLFDYRSGALLGETLDVGFHPDCVRFTEDGQHLLVANEGEYVKDSSAPGSLSVVDISGVKEASAEGVKGLTVQTYDFKDQDLAKIRVNEPGIPRYEAVEPEYLVGLDGRAYVTLRLCEDRPSVRRQAIRKPSPAGPGHEVSRMDRPLVGRLVGRVDRWCRGVAPFRSSWAPSRRFPG